MIHRTQLQSQGHAKTMSTRQLEGRLLAKSERTSLPVAMLVLAVFQKSKHIQAYPNISKHIQAYPTSSTLRGTPNATAEPRARQSNICAPTGRSPAHQIRPRVSISSNAAPCSVPKIYANPRISMCIWADSSSCKPWWVRM